MKESDRIEAFTRDIWEWYGRHKRTLPWRDLAEKDADRRAYLVLVSEVMLQQTQVSRVTVLYKNFIQKYPHTEALSKAKNSEVLIAWRGLGYNNRALHLRDAAKKIAHDFDGVVPREMETLQSLPGVGHYTAAAVRNFAFGIPTACMDVNIRRILHRFFVGPENADGTWKKDDAFLLKLAEKVLTRALQTADAPLSETSSALPSASADWHAALMDFGSLVMTKNSPKWDQFSKTLKTVCMAYGKEIKRTKNVIKKEPGRMLGSRFVPNRIFRGKIIEQLRDHPKGLTPDAIGQRVALDWTMGDHREWLHGLLSGLQKDGMIVSRGKAFRLA